MGGCPFRKTAQWISVLQDEVVCRWQYLLVVIRKALFQIRGRSKFIANRVKELCSPVEIARHIRYGDWSSFMGKIMIPSVFDTSSFSGWDDFFSFRVHPPDGSAFCTGLPLFFVPEDRDS